MAALRKSLPRLLSLLGSRKLHFTPCRLSAVPAASSSVTSATLPLDTLTPAVEGCAKLPELTILWPFNLYPNNFVATFLDTVQVSTGLPWWATIAVVATSGKFITYGFNVYNYQKVQMFFKTSPKQTMAFAVPYLNNIVTKGQKKAYAMAYNERRFVMYKYGFQLTKPSMASGYFNYLPVIWQLFCHTCMVYALANLNEIRYIPLLSGGLSWSPNLTVPDPLLVLPTLALFSIALSLARHPLQHLLPLPPLGVQHLGYLAPVGVVLLGGMSTLPSDILIYIISVNLTTTLLHSCISHPKVMDAFGLLPAPEILNRMIPQKQCFMELGRSLDRQLLLHSQKEEQSQLVRQESHLLGKSDERPALEDSTKPETAVELELETHLKKEAASRKHLIQKTKISRVTDDDLLKKPTRKGVDPDRIAERISQVEKQFSSKG